MRLGIKLFFLLIVLFNVAYNATLPLHPDEAYYWVWSKNLALSYYDHPPMVAYAIRLMTVFGDSEVLIRLAAVAAMSGAAWLIYRTGCILFTRKTGEIALVIYLLVPMTQVGYLAVTPDPFLCFFWALSLYLVCRSLFEERPGLLALAGVSIGCTLLSKYTGVLLPASLLLFLLFTPRFRRLLVKQELLLAILFGVVVFSPVIAWNASHDWASFQYQFNHGVAEEKILKPASIVEFFTGQAAVSNPFFFLSLLFFLAKERLKSFREPRLAILVWPFIFTLLFFGYNSLYKKSELNWAMPAMVSGSVLLAHWLLQTGRARLIRWAGVFTLLAVIFFKGPELVPFMPSELVMKNKFLGYDHLFSAADLRRSDEFVLSDNYENASAVAYYLPGRPEVYILETAPLNQYTFWHDRLSDLIGRNAIWIGEDEPTAAVISAFSRVEHFRTLVYENRFGTKRFNVFRCSNYKGLGETK
ncbi:MAG: glycosyl transferase family 39 [Anaerosporomusa subterranea]|jgi:4-amino-4-deoxy-L-arabinose transferase-like glycosyltransferase|nr:glycosyl transferase family 39 [Anaerosporomusa subterranea]